MFAASKFIRHLDLTSLLCYVWGQTAGLRTGTAAPLAWRHSCLSSVELICVSRAVVGNDNQVGLQWSDVLVERLLRKGVRVHW
jgi:hypothetical protein